MRIKIFTICVILFISGCSTSPTKNSNPNFLVDLKNGNITLSGGDCGFSWGYNNSSYLYNLAQENWEELALQMHSHGCTQDVAYYFLARSAEGLGFKEAAKKYYRISIANSKIGNHFYTCSAVFDMNCYGFSFPKDSLVRLNALNTSKFKNMPAVLEVVENDNTVRLNGVIKGISGEKSDDFTFHNNSGIKVCSGKFSLNRSKTKGRLSINCFNGKFSGSGKILSIYYNQSRGEFTGACEISSNKAKIKMLFGPNIKEVE